MQHVAVPPGTAPGIALQLRGPEPEIVMQIGHPLQTSCPAGLHLTPVPGFPGFESAANSSILVALGGAIFTTDPNFLASALVEMGILPASLEALLVQLMGDGLDLSTPRVGNTALTELAFDVSEVVDSLDLNNLRRISEHLDLGHTTRFSFFHHLHTGNGKLLRTFCTKVFRKLGGIWAKVKKES